MTKYHSFNTKSLQFIDFSVSKIDNLGPEFRSVRLKSQIRVLVTLDFRSNRIYIVKFREPVQ